LRGLLAGGVLAFAFGGKRWRVNYGLVANRTPTTRLAVPYRAKDSPAPRAEFSHPHVVMVLTHLCYYYGGLGDDELFTAFDHLAQSDRSHLEYHAWTKDAPGLSAAFMSLEGVNLRDRRQCQVEIFPHLRTAKSVVDYFVSRIVFPKEMKEFPHKLAASGWDLGKVKDHPTTGFSGTNDSREVLPLDVEYLDLGSQKFTNALVLCHLLGPENAVAPIDCRGQDLSDAERLLQMVVGLERPTQVILDVGAQILELGNLDVARRWLEIQGGSHMQAVVFFDDNDEMAVVDRKGHAEALQTSPYAAQLDVCLVYLDEAHTRGTDLKLPTYYRAAVTLGAGLTKDRLVQACMRLRKLGLGQSVVFCVPSEISIKIFECTGKSVNADIDVSDVLFWAISETFTDIRRSIPLWAMQGSRFAHQRGTWSATSSAGDMSRTQAQSLLEDEAQSIQQRYSPRRGDATLPWKYPETDSHGYLHRIAKRCREFEDLRFDSSVLSEEQERELAPEIEEERQVQHAAPAEPAPHRLHKDVIRFASLGVFVPGSDAYMPAFCALSNTSAAASFDPAQLVGRKQLFASADFVRTVTQKSLPFVSDQYQRSVQWVLTNRGKAEISMLIISPFEAQELMPQLSISTKASLSLYKPLTNLRYRSLDRLDFFTISAQSTSPQVPRSLAVQLSLFTGQLYLTSFEDFQETCHFLGLAEEETPVGWNVAADGFVLRDDQGRVGAGSGITSSPVQFLKELMTKIRQNGEDIGKSHMGNLVNGKLLCRSDFTV